MSGTSTPPPTAEGNLAQLLNNLTAQNVSAINIFSTAIGTLADFSGAFSVIAGLINLFVPTQQDPYLARILSALQELQNEFAGFEAQQNEMSWQNLSELIMNAVSVAESLTAYETMLPSLDDQFRDTQIQTCLAPLNALSDTTILPTGAFFLAPYSEQTYWTDAGLYVQGFESPDGSGGWDFSSTDEGYGTQAPPMPVNNQVFSYIYVLPYYLKAVAMLVATGTLFYSNFGQLWQGALISFAQFLTTIHNTIADGITKLTPPPPSSDPTTSDWWRAIGPDGSGITGIIGSHSYDDNAGIYFLAGATFIVGAVEIYSGCSSVNDSLEIQFGSNPFPPEYPIYQKLQVRALREMIKVYNGVGLFAAWNAINSLNQVAAQNPLPLSKYAEWSFQEILDQTGVPARSDGYFHLSDLANFIQNTPPFDTPQTGPPFSWQNLLDPS
jgi:hypothetical protein